MTRLIMLVIAGSMLCFSGCAENGSNDDDSLASLGAQCDVDQDCRRGVCSDDVCAMPSQACSSENDCLSWEFCDEGTCTDKCALMGVCANEAACERGKCVGDECSDTSDCLNWEMCMGGTCTDPCVVMDCAENHTCERGQCIPVSLCDGDECETCEDLMDCDAYSVCDDGVCVSNGLCEPWFIGWFVNAAGECEEGGKSGCNYPFDFDSEDECQASLNAGGLTECPEDSDVFFGGGERPTAAKSLNCEYGQECCCGQCYPSLVCHAEAGQTFGCYATDACMIPGCGCEADSDCEVDETCTNGFCQDACALIDCAEGYFCERGQCLPAETCMAYWEGAEHIGGQCVARNASGCSNPFTYLTVADCCVDYPDAGGCDVEETCTVHEDCSDNYHYCEGGVCVHNGDCDAMFEGWYLDGNGECNSGAVSGCDTPFPYQTELACCAANDGACGPMSDDEKSCVNAGGDWELFNNSCADGCGMLERPCFEALTMSCDCGPDACWDGEDCVGSDEGACKTDSECPDGTVCEAGLSGAHVCVTGCHNDGDCVGGEVCNDEIDCFAPPCPGQCEQPARIECKDDSDCEYRTVCESDRDGTKICVTGCHDDSDCGRGQSCNTDIVCVTTPCPGLCEPLAQGANCGDRTCNTDSAYCQKSFGGVRPPQGNGITYACQDLPADCSDAPAEKLCECLFEGSSGAGMECSVDASGLATVSVYLP